MGAVLRQGKREGSRARGQLRGQRRGGHTAARTRAGRDGDREADVSRAPVYHSTASVRVAHGFVQGSVRYTVSIQTLSMFFCRVQASWNRHMRGIQTTLHYRKTLHSSAQPQSYSFAQCYATCTISILAGCSSSSPVSTSPIRLTLLISLPVPACTPFTSPDSPLSVSCGGDHEQTEEAEDRRAHHRADDNASDGTARQRAG